jgi:hypothetical protein
MNGLLYQDAELKAEKHGGKTPQKPLENWGEKYSSAKITRVNTIIVSSLQINQETSCLIIRIKGTVTV